MTNPDEILDIDEMWAAASILHGAKATHHRERGNNAAAKAHDDAKSAADEESNHYGWYSDRADAAE